MLALGSRRRLDTGVLERSGDIWHETPFPIPWGERLPENLTIAAATMSTPYTSTGNNAGVLIVGDDPQVSAYVVAVMKEAHKVLGLAKCRVVPSKTCTLGRDPQAQPLLLLDCINTAATTATARTTVYDDRLGELREAALEEGYELNEGAAEQFILFMDAATYPVKRPGIALAGDGDINAIWTRRAGPKCRLSVQVFDDGDVEYVLLVEGESAAMEKLSHCAFWSAASKDRLREILAA